MSEPRDERLAEVVEALCAADDVVAHAWKQSRCAEGLPSRAALIEIVELLRSAIFPGHFGDSELTLEALRSHVGATLERVARALEIQVRRGLCLDCDGEPACCEAHARDAHETTRSFLRELPEVRRVLATDVLAAYESDPAASSPDEAIFCYPGIKAITNYRLAHALWKLGVPLIPRIITEHAHSETGIDIHPGATIGERFFIDHGTGVVIGETAILGARVRVFQGVTLGAKSLPLENARATLRGVPRHPIVEDDVTLYSGATILGRVTIGRGSVIGGNVWLTHDVPAGSRVTQDTGQQSTTEGL
jgi:serine O-acetyltransferase